MGIATPGSRDDPVVRVSGRVLGQAHPKLGTLFETLQNEVRAVALAPFHALAIRADVVFPLEALGFERFVIRPLDGDPMVARGRLDPLLVLGGPCPERLFRDRVDPVHIPEEVDDVLRARQQREVALDDDAIETVVYQDEQAAKQLAEGVHRSSPFVDLALTPRSLNRGPMGRQRSARV